MDILRDDRGHWLNAWAERHVLERRGEPFPREDEELWKRLDEWIALVSNWYASSTDLDPVELAGRASDKVLRYSQAFRGDATLTSWLSAIIRNTLRTMLKKRKNIVSIDDESVRPTEEALCVPHPAELQMLVAARRSLLSELLAQLPNQEHAEIFSMVKIDGCSPVEVAKARGLSPGTVRGIVCRCLRFLSSMIKVKEGVNERNASSQGERVRRAAN